MTFTIVPSFVDTNILVYAEDRDAGDRHERARDLVADLWKSGDGVLSVQVLQEFYVTITRKLRRKVTLPKAAEIVSEYLTWKIVDNTPVILVEAIALQQRAAVSFWDAMVIQAALTAGCDRLYSEDLNAGQKFGRLQIVNPFHE